MVPATAIVNPMLIQPLMNYNRLDARVRDLGASGCDVTMEPSGSGRPAPVPAATIRAIRGPEAGETAQ
jgi:hypothetical protein